MEESGADVNSDTWSTDLSEWVRYTAPEVIEGNSVPTTMNSDTFSFAMTVLECITEEVPFSGTTRDAAVINARITKGKNPPRPGGQDPRKRVDSDDLWNLVTRCWSHEPDQRPTMAEVHSVFLLHV